MRWPLLAASLVVVLTLVGARPVGADCAVEGASAYQPHYDQVTAAMVGAACRIVGESDPSPALVEVGYPSSTPAAAGIPAIILKAIGKVESSWRQAYDTARGDTGDALVSYDCGYGIMQITSGMANPGDLPTDVQQQIATSYRYNVAYGAKMLIGKWNYAPEWVAPVGSRDPGIAEDWYYAVWAYNYWGWYNNPNNPDYPWPRGAFDGSQSRGDYPYQELVWGYAAHPPTVDGAPLWSAVALTLPDRDAIGATPGWIATPSPSHRDPCALLEARLPVVMRSYQERSTRVELGGGAIPLAGP